MKYDDFLLKRRRRRKGGLGGRVWEDRLLPMVCMPGAAERTGQRGARGAEPQHPGYGPLLPAP